jgi:hypothetical protein
MPYFERRGFKEMDAPGPGRMVFHSMKSYLEERK